jgi:predicted patatin/cPLA2 family phospholipase
VIQELNKRLLGVETGNMLVLAVAGGGMRGVVTGGMLAGLEEIGVSPEMFDRIIGVSAGAVGAAYFTAKQARLGVRIYWEHLAPRRFIDARRLVLGRPVMDLSVLFNSVMKDDVPLDVSNVVELNVMSVLAASPSAVGTVELGPARNANELLLHLRASCHVPLLAGRAPNVDGVPLFDGSLTEPIPVFTALNRGATHVLVLSSTPRDFSRAKQTLLEAAVSTAYNVKFPGIHEVIAGQVRSSSSLRIQLTEKTTNPTGPPHILEIAPKSTHSPNPLCMNVATLEEAAFRAAATVQDALSVLRR